MEPTLHTQNGYIYLMLGKYVLQIYTDIDQATKDYEGLK